METTPYIVTIILNTDRREDTLRCLETLHCNTHSQNKIIVLDNASADGSVEAICEAFPKVEIVELAENLGYGGNNNVGIRLALKDNPDWILLLNEDTIVDRECLTHMIDIGKREAQIGIMGPTVYHLDSPEVIQSAGGRLSRFWEASHIAENQRDQGLFVALQDVDWISGCCIMIRRQLIQQIGMLDERYFYYWDETDFCIRARQKGWRIVHVPQAKIWHKGVQLDYRPGPSVTYYATRNRLLTLAKHKVPLAIHFVVWAQLIRTLVSWTVKPRWKHMRGHRNALLRGMLDFIFHRWGKLPG